MSKSKITMTKIERIVVINRPVEEVFSFVTNAIYTAKWFPWMIESGKISPGLYDIGTLEYEILHRFYFFGRKVKNICTVTNYQSNKIIERDIVAPHFLPWRSRFSFEPVGGGTKVTYTIMWEPIGLYRMVTSLCVIVFTIMDMVIPLGKLKALLESKEH